MNMLTVHIRKISPTHHTFAYSREGGIITTKELETKSFLTHDFLHFCVEMEAKTDDGFYGALAAGKTLEELSKLDINTAQKMKVVEQIVGALTGITKGADVSRALHYLRQVWELEGVEPPIYFTEEFIKRVEERYRKLIGEWKSLPFGETLTLTFNPV